LSFMLTGDEPRDSVENPLTARAYEVLSEVDPPGISLLIARCLQPLAKNRFGRMERLVPFTRPGSLPTPATKGFGMLQLPAPWSGAERPDSRAARSSLSAGPLISVSPEDAGDEPIAEPPRTQPAERERSGPPVAAIATVIILAVLVVLALAVVTGLL